MEKSGWTQPEMSFMRMEAACCMKMAVITGTVKTGPISTKNSLGPDAASVDDVAGDVLHLRSVRRFPEPDGRRRTARPNGSRYPRIMR